MGVRELPPDFATVRSQPVIPETRVTLAKTGIAPPPTALSRGADLELTTDRGERPVPVDATAAVGHELSLVYLRSLRQNLKFVDLCARALRFCHAARLNYGTHSV